MTAQVIDMPVNHDRAGSAEAEPELIAAVHEGISLMDDGVLMAGRALVKLREGPRKDLTREQWDTWLKTEFARIGHATASKWMTVAKWDGRARDELGDDQTVSVWKHLPPRWTTQYDIASKLRPAEVAEAVDAGEITALKTAAQINETIRRIKGTSDSGQADESPGTHAHAFQLACEGCSYSPESVIAESNGHAPLKTLEEVSGWLQKAFSPAHLRVILGKINADS